MIAVIADIHANRPALAAVLDEARRRGATSLLVLGDVLGYHAEPEACVELLAGWPCQGVLGNHDLGALGRADPYAGAVALAVQRWTAARLSAAARAYLGAWPTRLDLPWGTALHACFTHPSHTVGYVTPTTATANLAWLEARGHRRWLGLCGHSHLPALYSRAFAGEAARPEGHVELPAASVAILNPGSVGQPRDGDPRAAFALLDPEAWRAEFVRVAYDLEETARHVCAAGLDESIVMRLREGR